MRTLGLLLLLGLGCGPAATTTPATTVSLQLYTSSTVRSGDDATGMLIENSAGMDLCGVRVGSSDSTATASAGGDSRSGSPDHAVASAGSDARSGSPDDASRSGSPDSSLASAGSDSRSAGESRGQPGPIGGDAPSQGVALASTTNATGGHGIPERLEDGAVIRVAMAPGRWTFSARGCGAGAPSVEGIVEITEARTTTVSIAGATLPE